jgi:3-deoxy-D-manno-octulosonic-acid transferase
VENLKHIFPEALLYSELKSLDSSKISTSQILIIDSIGLLSRLYSYADVAVVGGGFHASGLHNILEAATFGAPVFFGNQYRKNPEADALIEARGGKSFEDEEYAANFICSLFDHEELLQEMSENAEDFVTSQPNSSELIVEKILRYEK